jgi:hypothetical protein
MNGLPRLLVLAILFLLAFFGSATAALVDLTWTGTTLLGNDGIGLFGPVGTIPAGTAYTAKYRFDTSISFIEDGTNGSQKVSGGAFYNPFQASPLVSAEITVNGQIVPLGGDYNSIYFRKTGQGASQIGAFVLRHPSTFVWGEISQRVSRDGNFYTLPLDQPGEFNFDASDNPAGLFSQTNHGAQSNILDETLFGLVPSHLSITLAVPEPTSFICLVVGTLGIYPLLRRRRSVRRV